MAIWLKSEPSIKSAVLFGSSARTGGSAGDTDRWSDIDLQVIAASPALFENMKWNEVVPHAKLCLQVIRPATGNVQKLTAIFDVGQIDLVVVPYSRLYLARLGLTLGFHRRSHRWDLALNEIRTSMQFGYRFIKGEAEWRGFYSKILDEMPGVRVSDDEARNMANVFICDLLWIFQKLDRGELAAAQHTIHQSLAHTNLRLLRELRLRRDEPLKSFGLARHLESSLGAKELNWVRVDARSTQDELRDAAWRAHEGLESLMRELVPGWHVPRAMACLLNGFRAYPRAQITLD